MLTSSKNSSSYIDFFKSQVVYPRVDCCFCRFFPSLNLSFALLAVQLVP
jgi:hypothetical protein